MSDGNSLMDYVREGLIETLPDGTFRVVPGAGIPLTRQFIFEIMHHNMKLGEETPAEMAQEILDALEELEA